MDSNEKTHQKVIEDICDECSRYCILKEILVKVGMGDRELIQLKCIEKFKYERGIEEQRDIKWDGAFKQWTEKGYAEIFDELYKDGMKVSEVYKMVIERAKETGEKSLAEKVA